MGNFFGAGAREKLLDELKTVVSIGLLFSGLVLALGLPCSGLIFRLMRVQPEAMADASRYLRIIFVGMPFTCLYNYPYYDIVGQFSPDLWEGTDWINESYHKGAVTQNHSISLAGGTEASKFNLGFAYTGQDGILGGETQSQFDRYNVRINSSHAILRSKSGFDVITIGENFNMNRTSRRGISQSNMYWNNVHDLMNANPLLPVYDENENFIGILNDSRLLYWISDLLINNDYIDLGLTKVGHIQLEYHWKDYRFISQDTTICEA